MNYWLWLLLFQLVFIFRLPVNSRYRLLAPNYICNYQMYYKLQFLNRFDRMGSVCSAAVRVSYGLDKNVNCFCSS